jgi:hypothetical protein
MSQIDAKTALAALVFRRFIAWLRGHVECPNCVGEGTYCLYCRGRCFITKNHAEEWHRQNEIPHN